MVFSRVEALEPLFCELCSREPGIAPGTFHLPLHGGYHDVIVQFHGSWAAAQVFETSDTIEVHHYHSPLPSLLVTGLTHRTRQKLAASQTFSHLCVVYVYMYVIQAVLAKMARLIEE